MTPEQTYFFRVLSDHIHGAVSDAPGAALDCGALWDLISRQSLCGVFYAQCKACLPKDSPLLPKLRQGFCSDVFRAVNQQTDFAALTAALDGANIPFLATKGTLLAPCWPAPELRTMGDRDLVIRPEDREKTDALMHALHYAKFVDNHAVWTYIRDTAVYEIHDHMMYEPLANDFDYRSYFDGVWGHTVRENGRPVIRPEFHFLYLMAHTAKHILNKGCGVRAFLDLVFLVRSKPALDWAWITEQLEELRLLQFTRTCFALCQRWFGVQMPLPSDRLDEAFFQSVTAKIFRDGLWGRDNTENDVGVHAKTVRRSRGPYFVTALRITVEKLFPSYDNMRLIPWYSFVEGRPWLLPSAWIYRFFYCACHKLRHSRALLAMPFTQKAKIRKRETMIDSWGL